MITVPLFANQLSGIQIKEVVFFILAIFIFLLTILAIIIIVNSIKDAALIKSQINILKSKESKLEQRLKLKYNQKVEFSLTYKVLGITIGLTILLIFLVAHPLTLLMIQNQEETLAAGLQRRVTLLMDSIAHGTKVHLSSHNTLELNLLTQQIETLVEAQSITILSYPKDTENRETSHLDYIWASNDRKILNKIDTSDLVYGESRINVPEINALAQEFLKLHSESKKKVEKPAHQISELMEEYKIIAEKEDPDSLHKKEELEILINELDTKLEIILHQIAAEHLGSFPPYDKTKIDNKNKDFLFYQPIFYPEFEKEDYLQGMVLVEINTENLIQSLEIAKKEILYTIYKIASVVILIGSFFSIICSFYIVNPIKHLQKHVAMIKNTSNKAELMGKKVFIGTKDEIGVLSANINEMTEDLAKAAIYESMLLGGKEVQRAFLPLDTIDGPNKVKLSVGHIETENVQFFGYYEGAKGVSGDFFDFKKLDERHFALIKCDVSDKGTPAALIMAEVSALFCDFFRYWSFEKDGINLQKLVYKINDHLETRNLRGKFAAFTLGLFDTVSGDIYFCNAGDNQINIYDSVAKKLKTITLPSTPAAGTFPTFIIEAKGGYPIVKIHLKKDDVLFLYTDGIEDSKRFFRNDEGEIIQYIPNTDKIIKNKNDNNGIDGEEFGKERIKDIIETVFSNGKYRYIQKANPIKTDDMNLIFDFTDLEGTPEDAIMALVSVEKIFRLYISPSAKSYDYGIVDKKIDKFLQLYFNHYDILFSKKIEHPNPDLKDEYLYYASIKEEEQTDDLTLVAIKKK